MLDELRNEDVKARVDIYIRLVSAGILTPNDVRLSEGLGSLPDGWRRYKSTRSEKNEHDD